VRTDGTITCWGQNRFGEATPASGIFTSVAAGDGHSCGVRLDGTLACWGRNDHGQATPSPGIFSSLSAGGWSTCGVRRDGDAACWGTDGDSFPLPPAEARAAESRALARRQEFIRRLPPELRAALEH
jgi:alpha-tubulin suppressor-like RCC1 family protein